MLSEGHATKITGGRKYRKDTGTVPVKKNMFKFCIRVPIPYYNTTKSISLQKANYSGRVGRKVTDPLLW